MQKSSVFGYISGSAAEWVEEYGFVHTEITAASSHKNIVPLFLSPVPAGMVCVPLDLVSKFLEFEDKYYVPNILFNRLAECLLS